MPRPNQFPLRIDYVDVDGIPKSTAPFYGYQAAAIAIAGLRSTGVTNLSVSHDGAITASPGMSYSKYPGNPHRKWNGSP